MQAKLSATALNLPGKVTRLDVMRYGHAMSAPVPGTRSSAALFALQQRMPEPWQRLQFAHSDLSGYAVFLVGFWQRSRCGFWVESKN